MAEGDVIDRVAIEMVIDGKKVLDEWLGVKKEVEASAIELRDRVKEIMSEGQILATLVASAREWGVTLEEAAERWQGKMAVGGATLEELNNLIDGMRDRIPAFNLVADGLAAIRQQAEALGIKLTEAQIDEKSKQLVDLAASANTDREAFQAVNRELKATAENLAKMGRAQQSTNKDLREANPLAALFANNLRGIVQGLIGLLGVSAAGQAFVRFLKESFQRALQFSEAMTRLAIEVRANQREFGESAGTIREWGQFVKDLAQRYIGPTATEIAAATARALAMGDALDLTTEQMQGLIEASNILAIAQGRNLQEVMTGLIQFLTSGYSIGLRNLGIDLDELERKSGRAFRSLSAQERVALVLPAILEQAAERSEDLAAAQDTLAGQMNAANQRMDNAQLIVGGLLGPAFVALNNAFAAGAELIAIWQIALTALFTFVLASVPIVVAGWNTLVTAIKDGVAPVEALRMAWVTEAKLIIETTDIVRSRIQELIDGTDGLGDVAAGNVAALSSEFAILGETADEAADTFLRVAKQYSDGMERIRKQFDQTLADITLSVRRAQADAYTSLVRDLEDIDRNAAERRLEVIRDNQIDEIRLRQDHLLNIRRLEENYLLELEDAVRERDARQVLMLMRRFNLEKQRRDEDYKLRQQRLREGFLLELADIDRQRQIRRAERMDEYRQELEDIALQAERRRADASERFERERIDLLDAARRRIEAVRKGLDDERELRLVYLTQFYKDLRAYIGPNGYMDSLYRYSLQSAAGFIQSIYTTYSGQPLPSQYVASEKGLVPYTSKSMTKGSDPFKRFQRGGEFIATSPTSIMVGERPEVVDVTPLGAGGSPIAGMRDGASGQPTELHLLVDAEEGLAVRVADQTMNQMADLVVNITRHAPGAGPRV